MVDSGSVTIGGSILTELALRLSDEGLDAGEIAARLEEEKKKIIIVALVDTPEYLKRGGRISKTAAFAGTVLCIKPVIAVIDGKIHILGKARGLKTGTTSWSRRLKNPAAWTSASRFFSDIRACRML